MSFNPKRIGVLTPKTTTLRGLRETPARIEWEHVTTHDLGSQDLDQFDALLVLTDEIRPALVRFVCDEARRISMKPLLAVGREPDRLRELADVAIPWPSSRRDVVIMAQRIVRIVYSIEDDPESRGTEWKQVIGLVAIVATVPGVILGVQTGNPVLGAETAGAVVGTVSAILCGHGMRSRRSGKAPQ